MCRNTETWALATRQILLRDGHPSSRSVLAASGAPKLAALVKTTCAMCRCQPRARQRGRRCRTCHSCRATPAQITRRHPTLPLQAALARGGNDHSPSNGGAAGQAGRATRQAGFRRRHPFAALADTLWLRPTPSARTTLGRPETATVSTDGSFRRTAPARYRSVESGDGTYSW
jgi:hypothetical protein